MPPQAAAPGGSGGTLDGGAPEGTTPGQPTWANRELAVVAASVAGYAVVAALALPDRITSVYTFSDAPALPIIAESLALTGGHTITLPTQTSVLPLLFDALTGWVPGHQTVWAWSGLVLWIMTAVLVGAAAQRVAGRRGWMGGAVALAAPPVVVWTYCFQDNHVSTVVGTAALALHLTTTSSRVAPRRSLAMGVLSGMLIINDPQFMAAAIVPYAVALLAMGLVLGRPAKTALRPLLFFGAGSATGLAVLTAAMHLLNIEVVGVFRAVPTGAGIGRGLTLSGRGFVWLFSGDWYGDPLTSTPWAWPIAAAAATLPLVVCGLEIRSARRGLGSPARLAYSTFWAVSEVALVGSLAISGASLEDIQAHYMVQCFICLAATLPLLPRPRVRFAGLGALAAAGVIAVSAVGLARVPASSYALPVAPQRLDDLIALLDRHGLTHGYSGYWDSFSLTWRTQERITAYPLIQGDACIAGDPAVLCRYGFTNRGWYLPKPGRFFVTARSLGCLTRLPSAARYGSPSATYHVDGWTVWVYERDPASGLVEPQVPLCSEGTHRLRP